MIVMETYYVLFFNENMQLLHEKLQVLKLLQSQSIKPMSINM